MFQTEEVELVKMMLKVLALVVFRGGIGRGRNREVKCYTCGEVGHMSWDCPRNKSTGQRNVNVAEDQEELKEETEVNNPREDG